MFPVINTIRQINRIFGIYFLVLLFNLIPVKFPLFLLLILVSIGLSAQNDASWPEEYESMGSLDTTDFAFATGQYYKFTDISLKAGEGVFLYMLANAFEPAIYSADFAMLNLRIGSITEFGTDLHLAYLPVIAKNDTIIQVVYSSVEKSVTGDFAYGFRKLSSSQMKFDTMSSYCEKLNFLINNWQCWWELVSPEDFYPTWGFPYKTSNISLVYKGSVFMRMDGLTSYNEILFMNNSSALAKSKYDEIIENTINCVSDEKWDIITLDSEFNTDVNFSRITRFTLKGMAAGQILATFEISLFCDEKNGCDVTIYFL